MIWAIIRSIAFVAFAPLVAVAISMAGVETSSWKWWLIPITTFTIPAALLWRAYRYGHDLEEKAKPQIRIEFGDGLPFDRMEGDQHFFLIRLLNGSPRTIKNCKLNVVAVKDHTGKNIRNFVAALRRQGTNNVVFPLRPNDPKDIDIVFLREDVAETAIKINYHSRSLAERALPRGNYTIELMAVGDDVAGTPAAFSISVSQQGRLEFRCLEK